MCLVSLGKTVSLGVTHSQNYRPLVKTAKPGGIQACRIICEQIMGQVLELLAGLTESSVVSYGRMQY